VRDVVRDPAMDYGEVELVCALTDPAPWEKALSVVGSLQAMTAPQAAALACLGDSKARERTVRAVASPEEREVRAAQAYLRHRPIEDASQLRALAQAIAAMKHEPAQVRALETLARHHVDDAATLDELGALFMRARSEAVRRAIAEVYLRSGSAALARAPAGVETLLRRLSS